MSPGIGFGVSGKARVYCLHDRLKREVVTEAHVAELARELGIVYDPKQHRVWRCGCCENLFVDPSDEPRLCRSCQRPTAHPVNGPLPSPNGTPL